MSSSQFVFLILVRHEQFPATLEEKRKHMYPITKRYRQTRLKTRLVGDKPFNYEKLFDESDRRVANPR